MATAIDKLAAEKGVKACDIIRAGMAYFLNSLASASNVSIDISSTADPTALAAPSPVKVDRWRGNGRQDIGELRKVKARQAERNASGKAGERLQD